MVTEAVAEQTATTGASVLSSTLRRDLFLAFGCWAPEEFHSLAGKADDLLTSQRWIKMLTYGTSKLKDVDARTAMLTDMRRSMEALQLSAIQVHCSQQSPDAACMHAWSGPHMSTLIARRFIMA